MTGVQRFLDHQRFYTGLAIFVYLSVNALINASSVLMEHSRGEGPMAIAAWEPFVWEFTSMLGTLALIPALLWFIDRNPVQWQRPGQTVLRYLLASILFSLLHVGIMVALRKGVYWLVGGQYVFGELPFELIYEYRKDLWGFVFFVLVIYSYRFILTRLQGEANWIADGEDATTATDSERMLVKKLGKEFIIKVADIEWMESSGNYVNLHLGGRIYPTRSTLSDLVKQLESRGFCRIHRSHAVNLDSVDSIDPSPSGDGEVLLHTGVRLNLSRRYRDALKQRLSTA